MSMADMIDERLVSFGLDVTNKEDAIRKICKMMYDAGKVSSYEDYLQGVKDRELEFETGMGNGIAIPHCKGGCVKEAAFTLVKLNQKIEWVTLNEVKFAHGFFDGDKPAVIWNVAHDIRHNCGFSRACRAGIYLRNSVNKRYRKELVNFLGAHFALDELLFCYLAGIYDSYGNRNSHLIAHDERMYSRNSDILVKVASDQRS